MVFPEKSVAVSKTFCLDLRSKEASGLQKKCQFHASLLSNWVNQRGIALNAFVLKNMIACLINLELGKLLPCAGECLLGGRKLFNSGLCLILSVFLILWSVLNFGKCFQFGQVFLISVKCFQFWEVLSVLGCVFYSGVCFYSGECFQFWEVFQICPVQTRPHEN